MSIFAEEIEKVISNIRGTKIWIKRRERKILIQDLKIHIEFFKHKDKKAKGEIKIKTFIIIYLREYDKARFIKPKEMNPFINPSKEKMLKEALSIEIKELKFWIIPRKTNRCV